MDSKSNLIGLADVSRRRFIGGAAMFGAAARLDAVGQAANPFKAEDYVALRLKVNGQIQGDWVIYEVQDAL